VGVNGLFIFRISVLVEPPAVMQGAACRGTVIPSQGISRIRPVGRRTWIEPGEYANSPAKG
jgi:hypothetical protein